MGTLTADGLEGKHHSYGDFRSPARGGGDAMRWRCPHACCNAAWQHNSLSELANGRLCCGDRCTVVLSSIRAPHKCSVVCTLQSQRSFVCQRATVQIRG